MNPGERERLITDWITMHHLPEESEEYKIHSWAERQLCELGRNDPELCLDIILTIIDRDQTNRVMANLAAGPLEDLLSEHGDRMINRVVTLAKSNDRFKHLLGGVWQGDMSDELWTRLQDLVPNRW
jgi:hypothetical protein